MSMSTGWKIFLGVMGGVVVLGGLYFIASSRPAAPSPEFRADPTPAAPPQQQDDTARAVGDGLRFGGTLLERLVPSADERLRAQNAQAAREAEERRFNTLLQACATNPSNPVCTRDPHGGASTSSRNANAST